MITLTRTIAIIRRPVKTAAAALALLLMVSACGNAEPAASTTTTTAPPSEIAVTAIDFEFVGLPERVSSGVQLTLSNDSSVELHELVAIRLPDDENRPVAELAENPDELAA